MIYGNFSDVQFYQYTGNEGFVLMNSLSLYKQSSFLIEKVKAAQTIGILVCTLAVEHFLVAIEHVKTLCKRRQKKFYVISLGKPTPAKLANFTEVNIENCFNINTSFNQFFYCAFFKLIFR